MRIRVVFLPTCDVKGEYFYPPPRAGAGKNTHPWRHTWVIKYYTLIIIIGYGDFSMDRTGLGKIYSHGLTGASKNTPLMWLGLSKNTPWLWQGWVKILHGCDRGVKIRTNFLFNFSPNQPILSWLAKKSFFYTFFPKGTPFESEQKSFFRIFLGVGEQRKFNRGG